MIKVIQKLLALLLGILVFWFSQASAEPVRITYSVVSSSSVGVWMAKEFGTFKKYGLDVQLIFIPTGSTNVQALIGGGLDIIVAGSSGVVIAGERGASIVAIGSTMNRSPMTLYVQPEINKVEELKGKVIGITRFNTSNHLITTLALRKLGLLQSVTLRQLGGVPEVKAALEQKQIAGMMTSVTPEGPARALLNPTDLDVVYAMNVLATTREYLRDHTGVVERVLRAYIEGVAIMIYEKERAIKVLQKYFRRTDPGFLDEMYLQAKNYTERVPRVDPRIISPILEFAQIKGTSPETVAAKVIDNGLVDKLVGEKFIEKLFSK
jgi:ABC-type nitrate/sulfonate/bicarbonate transport system substrate-binding protein